MKNRKILIIDDEDIIGKACKMILTEEGFLCNHCSSGKDGLKMALDNSYNILLLDIKLKDMNGMDILEKVKKAKPEVYVIVITGYSTVENAVRAMKLGANDYLSKPFSDDDIISAVEEAFKN